MLTDNRKVWKVAADGNSPLASDISIAGGAKRNGIGRLCGLVLRGAGCRIEGEVGASIGRSDLSGSGSQCASTCGLRRAKAARDKLLSSLSSLARGLSSIPISVMITGRKRYECVDGRRDLGI